MRITDYESISKLSQDDIFLVSTSNGTKTIKVSDLPNNLHNSDIQSVMFREQKAAYGYYGIEQNLDELMEWVRAGDFDKFAVGDYFIELTSVDEKIMWEVAGKNSYLRCGDGSGELNKNHIVCCPRDCLETYYKFNETATNTGGYAASSMPANLEIEANKFSSKLQGYMTPIRRLEDNKGAWAWTTRRIFLPGTIELCNSCNFIDMYSSGSFNQLQLFVGGSVHILKGAGFNKKKASRISMWTADPVTNLPSIGETCFCNFTDNGHISYRGANDGLGIAPLIVLS